MNFSAKIKINDCIYDCHAENSELTIIKSDTDFLREREKIGWENILNKWIEVFSDDEFDIHSNSRTKYLMLLSYKNGFNKGILHLSIIACIDFLERNDSIKTDNIVKHISIRSKALDMFYWANKKPNENVEILASKFGSKENINKEIEKHSFKFNDKEVNLYFDLFIAHKHQHSGGIVAFPFDIFVLLNVECDKGLIPEEVLTLCYHIKAFLSFVSNTRDIMLEEILINSSCYMNWEELNKKGLNNYPSGEMFIAQETNRNDKIIKIIPYDFVKENISSIFDEIVNRKICFISLFQYDENIISSVDIVNICATFENQFRLTFPNFRDASFDKTKHEVLEKIKELENSSCIDSGMLSEFITWNSVYKGVLKSKLDYAMDIFEKMFMKYDEYWNFEIERLGGQNYKEMTKRIKKARDFLSHGKEPKDRQALPDTVLLRAIVYMLILRKANVADESIIECIKALFGY